MTEKRFVCVLEIEKRSVLSATANNAVTEKLFVPRANQPKKVGTLVQLELNFD